MSADRIIRATSAIASISELLAAAIRALARGDYRRVEELLPDELRTSAERRLADERARDRWPAPGEGHQ